MRKKEFIWIAVLLALAGVYVHYFTNWFQTPQIAIEATFRPNRRANPPSFTIAFTLNGDYKLTKLKVVPLNGATYNPTAPPVWNLESDSNSAPVRAFEYGRRIRGMKPVLEGVRPEPLTPGTTYRMVVTAGNATGHKDFKMPPMPE